MDFRLGYATPPACCTAQASGDYSAVVLGQTPKAGLTPGLSGQPQGRGGL